MNTATQTEPNFNITAIMQDTIKKAMHHTGGNVTKAAQLLGVDRRTVQRNLKVKMGMKPADFFNVHSRH